MLSTILRISRHRGAVLQDKIHPNGAERRRRAKLVRGYRQGAARSDARAAYCKLHGPADAAAGYTREAQDLRSAADMINNGATEHDVAHLLPPPF